MSHPLLKISRLLATLFLILLLTTQSVWQAVDVSDRVRMYTRPFEFDYFYWTLQALWEKSGQTAMDSTKLLSASQQRRIVFDFIELLDEIDQVDRFIGEVYANPITQNPTREAAPLLEQKQYLENRYAWLAPLAESVLQFQIQTAISGKGLGVFGQVFPPVLFRMSEVPDQLIISPRDIIKQETGISLQAGFTAVEMDELEDAVSQNLDVSALVVPLGGVGVYPTMVYRTGDLQYLLKIIAHEWTHNYLTMRPLGWNYNTSPQLRSMNETTADIFGTEISTLVMQLFYGDLLPGEDGSSAQNYEINFEPMQQKESFNFQKEMHATRVRVDELLALGKVAQAETYMEIRRKFFWENGYKIRKLNQAYFAFYGAYAEQPLGAAGNDPVGPAVRALRYQSESLAEFMNRIAWMTSFEQLQQAVNIY